MNLFEYSAGELHKKLLAKECSAVEITESVLERIDACEEKVGAYLTVTGEQAKAAAAKVDAKIAAGEEIHPLAGIPMGIKDNICTKGVTTTCASKMLYNFVPPYNATVMDKLEGVDAVMIGKLNMDEFAMGSSCENSHFKLTHNPRALARVPGGSSGGSAAAVAAGEAVVTLGSDTGGSIRQPAACCGIIGLKPTYGSVSRYGLVAFASSLDQIGPMGRTVEDVANLYSVICGRDPMDATSARREYPDFAAQISGDVQGMRIGLPKEYFGPGVEEGVRAAVMDSIHALEQKGAKVVELSLPSTDYALSAYYIISSAEASSNLARFDGVKYGYRAEGYTSLTDMYERTRSEGFGDEVKRRIMLGTFVLSSGYYDAYYNRAKLLQKTIAEEFAAAFEQCDVIATPTTPTTAFRLGENVGDPLKMYASDICTVTVNIAGLPAISLPCGMVDGLPAGLQLIGPRFSEGRLFNVSRALEQERGGLCAVAAL
ncbi:Asp-tRNA(Asn)/Glu-tRNA(Gln) amidotransferase subunit GatA [Angelakisella massiliensis]|uniref:Asp-tRNA(Asn)/Glu-tRNA(Gln) amidotransferase subunit GatA n=1 Tax=Angelakisella massiliensis TaxID=1871018 RepID=UPI0024B1AF51|nr:Asp-tRNA(Asn)/Glu-tRNA(Gln) amidotransferase subunit GatA [Angelakisella massiliensis]